MLHTVNKSPYTTSSLESCLRFAGEGDVVLLMEDGVYAAAAGTERSKLVESALQNGIGVCALQADLKARAVEALIQGVRPVDYDGWVELLEQHRCQAWL
ncbi:sulfurtransferase complex subunit TusB [Thiohalobacter sp. IOR34]|uniref:sulfurtransferase complex subunit TusB n=1 Tax=Thiohalobacter sp. IOR34 TaxID=3057176 RepID=UPI0025B0BE05|nr:sulfurtransferase complex subunit TusB [Thiohalobacter sp. IOR34]WJW76010.1 sulfurtransferase complex subunit TusB [Thiohalobacter sp. IOR34]